MTEPLVVAWRHPPQRGRSTPLVVLLHGRGADEYDLLDLAGDLPRALAFASVRGPVNLAGGGHTWFLDRGAGRPNAHSLRESVAGLRAWLDGPGMAQYAESPVFLLGFSAGMMMAGALLMDDPARFSGAVLLSGALALDAGIPASPGRLHGLPVFSGRGTLDEVIPAHLVTPTLAYLRDRSGAELTLREYPRGHAIARREIEDIANWFAAHA